MNRSPIPAEIYLERQKEKGRVAIFGCGLKYGFRIGQHWIRFVVNIETPYMPTLSESKTPDLEKVWSCLKPVLEKAAGKAQRARSTRLGSPSSQKQVVLEHLDEAIDMASGNRVHRYSIRQLYYQLRPYVSQELEKELTYGNFEKIITDYEAEIGNDLQGIYRDNRGTMYHPHLRQDIPLGTLSVEKYERPVWTFNKILVIEKEGFFEVLKEAHFPERWDCALLTSKGYASRALRDLLDLMADSGEPIMVFCIHDADGPGTMIYQSLVDETRARGARKVEVINLGLEPEEGVQMGLQTERHNKECPVADYVPDRWKDWLQKDRIELNAMTSPQFLAWLEQKITAYGARKVIPPAVIMEDHLRSGVEERVRDAETKRILKEARLDKRVKEKCEDLAPLVNAEIAKIEHTVRVRLGVEPAMSWRDSIAELSEDILEDPD